MKFEDLYPKETFEKMTHGEQARARLRFKEHQELLEYEDSLVLVKQFYSPSLWIIYHGDQFYPWREQFEDYDKAKESWKKLKAEREEWELDGNDPDYFAQVIDTNAERFQSSERKET